MLILILLPALGYWASRRYGWVWWLALPLMRFSDTRLMSDLPDSWRVRLRILPDVLRIAAWLLLLVALARPQSGRAQEIIRGQGIDIVLALDISGSMSTTDFEPQNRLEAAKSIISQFIAGREFDRIGLVVFARNAFHQSPPTLDYDVLQRLLSEIRLITEIPGVTDGTAIGLGIASAANMIRSSPASSKVIILLTDGDNETGLDPITAAEAVAVLGIRVYTVGMGIPGSESVDEETLQQVADITDGRFYRAEDLNDLRLIYAEIDQLERTDIVRQVFVRWQDQATLWLLGGLLLLLGERILRETLFQAIP
jgi:Ca-activated chloride channel family protein